MATTHRSTLAVASLLVAVTAATATGVHAQAISSDDMPTEDYLGLLRQIAPAAEAGARTYLAAHSARCGYPLNTAALRRAVADGPGDPALMGMIRAAQVKDQAAMQRLAQAVICQPRGER